MNFTPQFTTPDDVDRKTAATNRYEPVTKYMAKNLITFSPDQTIQEVIDIMLENKISGGPVLNEKKELIGMISERDCLKLIVDNAYNSRLPIERKVAMYMTHKVDTVSVNANIAYVADKFLKNTYRRFPVVDDHGRLMGQVSRRDILRAVKDMKVTIW